MKIASCATLLLIGAALVTPRLCFSQALPLTEPLTVNVQVEAKPEPKRAIGLVLSAGRTFEVEETTIKKIGEKSYLISFIVDRNIVRRDSVATAMAFDENGKASFANVSPELLSDNKNLLSQIPECPAEDPSTLVDPDQKGPLEQLVKVRTERTELARAKINELLDSSFLDRLHRFEDAFGLDKSEELSGELDPEVLVDRLSRITHAVKKYRMFKRATTQAQEN